MDLDVRQIFGLMTCSLKSVTHPQTGWHFDQSQQVLTYKSVDARAVVWSALQRWERAVQEGIRRRYAVEHANLP